ncbi:MAG: Gfo/Idh/MocA family oxidoreductase [Candidatus Rokubacteria bacterium]|nr:Gfo/Idh/MocA family oxidoreductase [Candidatus Rokubacteria bacterium]
MRAVIVGCGRIAGGYGEGHGDAILTHVAAYRKLGVDVVGCCDLDGARAEAFARRWGIGAADARLGRLLASTQPDIVSVCTPPTERESTLRTLIACGSIRAALFEKPLASTGDQAAAIARSARAWGRPVLVNYFRAYDPFYQQLVRECAGGRFGPVHGIVVRYYGSAVANASHLLERVLEMLGGPDHAARLAGDDEAPLFELRFRSTEARALFLPTPGTQYAPMEMDLLFEAGRIRVLDSEQRVEWFRAFPLREFEGYCGLVPLADAPTEQPDWQAMLNVFRELVRVANSGSGDERGVERAVAVSRILDTVGAGR